MVLKRLGSPFLVIPMAAIFLFFGGATAFAPDCHLETTAISLDQTPPTHSHTHSPTAHVDIAPPTKNVEQSSSLKYEMCFAVGFIIFLLLRPFRWSLLNQNIRKISFPEISIIKYAYQSTGFAKLSHLTLGVIRV